MLALVATFFTGRQLFNDLQYCTLAAQVPHAELSLIIMLFMLSYH